MECEKYRLVNQHPPKWWVSHICLCLEIKKKKNLKAEKSLFLIIYNLFTQNYTSSVEKFCHLSLMMNSSLCLQQIIRKLRICVRIWWLVEDRESAVPGLSIIVLPQLIGFFTLMKTERGKRHFILMFVVNNHRWGLLMQPVRLHAVNYFKGDISWYDSMWF